jgi:hypothetical protein
MQPLFISYSRVDSAFALKLVRDLKARGIGAWMDQLDIRPGANWDEEIELALGRANIIVVILSSHSASSENVKNEIGHALELKKQVVPIVAAKGAVPLMITRLQREDFTGDYEAAFNKLVLRLGGAGRTETLAAISHEEVERISAASAERLAAERSAARAESAGRASIHRRHVVRGPSRNGFSARLDARGQYRRPTAGDRQHQRLEHLRELLRPRRLL